MTRLFFTSLLVTSAALAQATSKEPRVSVPDINGLAITLVKPAFPQTAIDVGADGATVPLKVVVDENGHVISAQCSTTCHPMLKDAAELAALTSKFKPQTRDGHPVKYEGTLLYTYVVNYVNWYRFGTSMESVIQFDNLSVGPVAQILSSDYAKEKARLLVIDENGGADFDTRQKVLSEVITGLKSRLKGADLWRLEMGMALRRVTFWTMARERTDRAAMQKALDELPRYLAAAPAGVSHITIQALTELSKYRVSPDTPEQDLRKAINELWRKISIDLQ